MTLKLLIFSGMRSLFDCTDLDRQAWNSAFYRLGLDQNWDWNDYAKLIRADGVGDAVAKLYPDLDSGSTAGAGRARQAYNQAFVSLLSKGAPLRPGVLTALKWATNSGIALGLVSRRTAQSVGALLVATARQRAGIVFEQTVPLEEVDHALPHPEAVELLLARFGVPPEEALLIAGSPEAAEAGLLAGVAVLGFPDRIAAADLRAVVGLPCVDTLEVDQMWRTWLSHSHISTGFDPAQGFADQRM